ncbi:sperm microtubule associated protein 2-like [Cololabis saira]|uniref:sperm microtubule associated protein 2-like n=1 Tax=Cololabis saira TaxID=129043 RepID=UPI002AD54AA1|nr:sperm microtubule associated protein 2-like [Cololabis saira]
MAHLRFSARSCSKRKNPIPSQAQKRLLSKGGPPEERGGGKHLQEDQVSFLQDAAVRKHCAAVDTQNQEKLPPGIRSASSSVSSASRAARVSQRLVRLSLPRLKESNICCQLGRPEEPVWTVSGTAKKATASVRVEMLAAPRRLSEDYVPPREAEWSRRDARST